MITAKLRRYIDAVSKGDQDFSEEQLEQRWISRHFAARELIAELLETEFDEDCDRAVISFVIEHAIYSNSFLRNSGYNRRRADCYAGSSRA